jgi:sugar lactone lactonase YvrE
VLALGGVAALVVAPLVWFAVAQPETFWSRVQDTYIFTGKSEAERLPALWGNIWKHLLMFNWRGDPNGRHNLPGAPMLDDIAGVLMVLGLGYSLWRSRDPRYALLPLWLGVTLLGGILSLDFEAPQSLRANGSLGAAYVLAVVPLAVLVRAWEASDGRWLRRWVWWPVALLLGLAAFANIRLYFDRWANDFSAWAAHSTAETLTAHLLADLDENTDAFVTSFFHGHPTLRFLLPTSRPFARLETTDQLPLDFAPGRGALLVINTDSRAQFEAAKALYPNAQFEEVMPPMVGPPVLLTARLSPEDVASIQGLDGSYYANAEWSGPPALVRRDQALDFDWAAGSPLPAPFSAEWDGVLHVAAYGVHDLVLQSPGYAELLIGEQQVLTGTGVLSGSLTLAAGNHALRVRAVGAPGLLQLRWRPPDRPLEVIGAGALYAAPMAANGLLARYFANRDWEGPEISARIEEQLGYYVHVPPLPRPYSVEYTGKIAIPQAGEYRFGLESIDESALAIDGQDVVSATRPNQYEEGGVTLDAGLHDIRIRFADHTDHTHLNVYWLPPGGTRTIIPAGVLFPPQGSYANVQLPTLASVMAVAPLIGAAPPAPQMAGAAVVFAAGLQQPRGIAVADDGRVYVAESGGGKVTVFTPTGEVETLLPRGSDVFVEPSDVAVDVQNLYVLDAGDSRLWRYPLDGSEAVGLAVEPELAGRARGLAVGPDGRLWIAATPGGIIAGVDQEGQEIVRLPVATGGEPGQPSDVLADASGLLYAVDTAAGKLIRVNEVGRQERSWTIPRANSLDGPHLAADLFGNLYISDPEGGRVEKRDSSGEAVGAWDLTALLNRPVKAVGLAAGPDGRIWVTDSDGGAVIVIEPE